MPRVGLWAVLMLMGLPGVAGAQVEEIDDPPPAAPAPPTAQAPAADAEPSPAPPQVILRTRYSRHRTAWYIGFSAGAGAGWVRAGEGDESGGGMGFAVIRVGWVARPWLLVGFEGSTWFRLVLDLFNDMPWIQTLHYDVVTTYFPGHDGGFYVRGGAGVGMAMVDRITVLGKTEEQSKDTGLDLKAGLGYEWQLLRSFNLGADLTYALVVFGGGSAHDLTAQLSFTWY